MRRVEFMLNQPNSQALRVRIRKIDGASEPGTHICGLFASSKSCVAFLIASCECLRAHGPAMCCLAPLMLARVFLHSGQTLEVISLRRGCRIR